MKVVSAICFLFATLAAASPVALDERHCWSDGTGFHCDGTAVVGIETRALPKCTGHNTQCVMKRACAVIDGHSVCSTEPRCTENGRSCRIKRACQVVNGETKCSEGTCTYKDDGSVECK